MRKAIIRPESPDPVSTDQDWLDIPAIARTELTSEEASHPIESALSLSGGVGWRAAEPGRQTIRLLFDEPLRIRRVHLMFQEDDQQRTQEFALAWSPDPAGPYREIVRQQYNFAPPDSSRETEDYDLDLVGVSALELIIIPDISGGAARASLARLCIA